jgi:hypothetical protein
MATTILDALNDLTAAIQALQTSVTVYNQNDVSPVCCEDVPTYYPSPITQIIVGEGDPPEGYPTWDDYMDDLCLRAQTAAMRVQTSIFELFDLAEISVASITIGIILGVIALIEAPFAIAAALVAILGSGSFEVGLVLRKQYVSDAYYDIVCAIYCNTTAAAAQTAILNVLGLTGLGAKSLAILEKLWHDDLMNAVYDQTLPIDPGLLSTYCEECCPEPTALFETNQVSPYNVLTKGYSITSLAEDATQGYKFANSGTRCYLIWQQEGDCSDFRITAEFGVWDYPCTGHGPRPQWNCDWATDPGGPWTGIPALLYDEGEKAAKCAWYTLTKDYHGEYTFQDGLWYRFQPYEYYAGWFSWARKLQGIVIDPL